MALPLHQMAPEDLDDMVNPMTADHIIELKDAIALGEAALRHCSRLEQSGTNVDSEIKMLKESIQKARGLLAGFDIGQQSKGT